MEKLFWLRVSWMDGQIQILQTSPFGLQLIYNPSKHAPIYDVLSLGTVINMEFLWAALIGHMTTRNYDHYVSLRGNFIVGFLRAIILR